MKKKKNRFLLFCFSFLPGAGEMYFGLMKTGVSLLGLFMASVMLAGYTQIGVLACASFVVWVYSFFHANNMGTLNDEEFARLDDSYLFGLDGKYNINKDLFTEKYRKVAAIILIVLGMTMLWQTFCNVLRHIFGDDFYYEYIRRFTGIISDDVPRLLIAFVIIWFGIKLIRGKKEELERLENNDTAGAAAGNMAGVYGKTDDFGQSTYDAAQNAPGTANNAGNDIPVERIEQVEVVDNSSENSGEVR